MNTSGISAHVIQLKDHQNEPLVCNYLKDLLPYVRRCSTRYLKKTSKTDVCLHTVVECNCIPGKWKPITKCYTYLGKIPCSAN